MRTKKPTRSKGRARKAGRGRRWRTDLLSRLSALQSRISGLQDSRAKATTSRNKATPAPSPAATPERKTSAPLSPFRRILLAIVAIKSASPIAAPLIASLSLHTVLIIVLMSATWSAVGGPGSGFARTEVAINLPAAPAMPQPRSQGSTSGGVVRPASVETALPRLQGLSTPAMNTLPTLRSAAGDAGASISADLLRSQDDSFIGGATFAGLGTRQASSVVYVVDASGAMITSLQFVLAELERSVRNLSSGQKFQVVLFRERPNSRGPQYDIFTPPGVTADLAQLVYATPANKAALSQWLKSIQPAGRSNPIEGLRRGLAFEPDAIFLLSRSIRRSGGELSAEPAGGVWGQPLPTTLAELERLNPRSRLTGNRRVIIKAIQFIEEDPSGTMQAIGNEHGDGPGSYSVLTLQALGAR